MTHPFLDILERRDAAARRVITALENLPSERAIVILLSWMPLDLVEKELHPALERPD